MSAAQIIEELPKLTAAELDAVRRKLAEIFAEKPAQPLSLPPKRTRAEIRQAIQGSKLQFDQTWDELRQLTREP